MAAFLNPPSNSVHTGVQIEKRSYSWKIDNFDDVRQSSLLISAQKFAFGMGSIIGLPTKWECCLKPRRDTQDKSKKWIEIFAELIEKPQGVETVEACFSVQIKRSFGFLYFQGTTGTKNVAEKDWGIILMDRNADVPLFGGALIIEVELTLYSAKQAVLSLPGKVKALEMQSTQEVCEDFKRNYAALTSPNLNSTTTFISKDKVAFPVNGGMLAARNSVFRRLLRENEDKQELAVDDLSAATLQVLLQYICTGHLHANWSSTDVVITELISAAHKFEIRLLQHFLDEALGSVCTMANATQLAVLAERFGMNKAQNELVQYIKTHLKRAADITADPQILTPAIKRFKIV